VPVRNAAGEAVTSWLNPLPLLVSALFLAPSSYVSAVFLVSDARRAQSPDLGRCFKTRAASAAVIAEALAVAGLVLFEQQREVVRRVVYRILARVARRT
jgi:cytochrome bd ubiquinol oxidase subunit II